MAKKVYLNQDGKVLIYNDKVIGYEISSLEGSTNLDPQQNSNN